ncbi:ankyrin repeat and SOCS box protein 8-like [Schistocerca nitens]|uniref:ankyrin repeat and SOCS box protein 8-like n=1 Tax=Schistocerca nitens TaxID=7011 RepID=UPI002118A32B|nr:ankyrin repeat and SOCS box protein 8-like [Schistocerca nitens]
MEMHRESSRTGQQDQSRHSDCCTPLYLATNSDSAEFVKLLAYEVKNLWLTDGYSLTVLHYTGNDESLKRLLRAAARSIPVRGIFNTLLIETAKRGNALRVRQLLQAKTDVTARVANSVSAVLCTVLSSNPECSRHLPKVGVDIQEKEGSGFTPLSRAPEEDSSAYVRLLVEAGADVHRRNKDNDTPLHFASLCSDTE